MRKILFRAKKVSSDEWVNGDLLHTEKNFKKIVQIIDWTTDPYIYEVESSSIGQYTGLKDKNGVKIFEGDICMNSDKSYYPRPLSVEWIEEFTCFAFVDKGDFNNVYFYQKNHMENVTLIGNIHDNKDLIK